MLLKYSTLILGFYNKFALGIETDTGLWIMPVRYECKARPVLGG